MAQDPAFLFYYKDVLVSCADWDEDALAWYVRLLCHQADKQKGLPNDVEKLAVLAGVKFSKYERFVECWQHTLKAKFEANAQGLLINIKQDKNLKERRDYKEKQTQRGLVGHFMKIARKETSLSDDAYKELSAALFNCLSVDNSKEENEECFKRTLKAYIGIANAIGNSNEEKEGLGEKEFQQFPVHENYTEPLPEIIIGSVQQLYKLTKQQDLTEQQVIDFFEVFKVQNLTGKKFYADVGDVHSHFINWIKIQNIENGNKGSYTTGKTTNSGKSGGALTIASTLAESLGIAANDR